MTSEPLYKHLSFDLENRPQAQAAWAICKRLQEAGHTAYLAGGAVRDLLLGRTPKDFDVATSATPKEVCKLFRRTQKVGIAFGVVLVYDFSIPTEVATFRTDGEYVDGRRPESVSFCDAPTDAKRRDFSVNALFYDFETEHVLDFVEGLKDLKASLLSAIGDPEARFGEDYLRMLRALRFSLALNFTISEPTWQALLKLSPQVANIAPDRIHEEMKKIFSFGKNDEAFELLEKSSLGKVLFPCWQGAGAGVLDFSRKDLEQGGDFSAALALLWADQKPSKEKIKECGANFRCSKNEIRDIQQLQDTAKELERYNELSLCQKKRALRRLKAPSTLYFHSRRGLKEDCLKEIEKDFSRWSKEDLFPVLPLNGKDLMDRGFPKGAFLGEALLYLEDICLESAIIDPEKAWALLVEFKKSKLL